MYPNVAATCRALLKQSMQFGVYKSGVNSSSALMQVFSSCFCNEHQTSALHIKFTFEVYACFCKLVCLVFEIRVYMSIGKIKEGIIICTLQVPLKL